jgi:MarR family transcriptional regulator for hemolysin
MLLYDRDGRPPRISELGAHLSVDKANVSRLCSRMQEQGHVELRSCPDDGRAKRVHLTDEGERVAARVDRSSLQRFERILAALEAAEPGEVVGVLEALNEAIVDLESTTEESPDE